MNDFDFVIRRGLVYDGRGGEPYQADVGIRDGKIVEIGEISGKGGDEIDADGRMVTPGFVDLHTHYDGQVCWTERLEPSSPNGVTTAVMGNCGVGFAPCRPEDHEALIRLMEGIEDIPEIVLAQGLGWQWETYPDYLNFLGSRRYDIDFGSYLPHSAARLYVMGRRGADREPATDADIAALRRVARGALAAGALGFATSRHVFHRSSDGSPVPTRDAGRAELLAIAEEIAAHGSGVFQIVANMEQETEFAEHVLPLAETGIPVFFSMSQSHGAPDRWKTLLAHTADANARGHRIRAQVLARGVGFLLGFNMTLNPFSLSSTYRGLEPLPFDERIEALRDPAVRARILADETKADNSLPLAVLVRDFERMFALSDPPNYEPRPENSIAARARRQGTTSAALAYDELLKNDGQNQLYLIVNNYADMSLDVAREIVLHPDTVLGLGDAGAHCGTICDGSYPTFMLTHWGRDRQQGSRLDLPWLIRSLTGEPAEAIGLLDRGVIAPGYRADLNVIDFSRLTLHAPVVIHDMPAGGRRLLQFADGYECTLVNGVPTYRDGRATGALPGRLIRGQQAAPI